MGLVQIQALLPNVSGFDWLAGGAGDDIVIGGPGSDEVRGEQGRDFIAGDFLRMDFVNGFARDALTPFEYYFNGAGDTLRSGLDGDFVFGGTQFNSFSVAASVDVIFESFGRILFEVQSGVFAVSLGQGGATSSQTAPSIFTIFRVFNLGISSSFLDDRVADGQRSGARGEEGSQGSAGALIYAGLLDDDLTTEEAERLTGGTLFREGFFGFLTYDDFLAALLDQGFLGNAAASKPAAGVLGEDPDSIEAAAMAPSQAPHDQNEVGSDIASDIAPTLPSSGKPLAAREQIAGIKTPEIAAGNIVEDDDEFLALLATGGAMMAAASTGSFRQYGKSRSVGSLEQRLREWTGDGFALKGDSR